MDRCPACDAAVSDGDLVCAECGTRIGGSTESFEVVVVEEPAAEAGVFDATGVPVLVVRKGVEVGERFYLEQPSVTIGRDPESDIFLNDVTVSRSHAVLTVGEDAVRIQDAGSLNGTYVNDRIVTETTLQSGDAVQIGRFQMVFLSGGGA